MKPSHLLSLLMPLILVLTGCNRTAKNEPAILEIGNPDHGQQAMEYYGCASCHVVPGIAGAQGLIGPSLKHVASRAYIAGIKPNTPSNLIHWIENAPSLNPQTAMPDLEIPDGSAHDIASYIYTLK
jgi:cytochrome c